MIGCTWYLLTDTFFFIPVVFVIWHPVLHKHNTVHSDTCVLNIDRTQGSRHEGLITVTMEGLARVSLNFTLWTVDMLGQVIHCLGGDIVGIMGCLETILVSTHLKLVTVLPSFSPPSLTVNTKNVSGQGQVPLGRAELTPGKKHCSHLQMLNQRREENVWSVGSYQRKQEEERHLSRESR
jgi:hypothetical protein